MKRFKIVLTAAVQCIIAASTVFGQGTTVRITSPADSATYANCSDIPFVIEAQATGTTIKKIEVWENGALNRNLTKSPYAFNRTNIIPDAIYRYFVKAITTAGDTAVSDAIVVFVGNAKEGNKIANGEFNCSALPWRLDQYVNALATLTIDPNLGITSDSSGAYIEIQNVGDATWAVQLMQPFVLQKGHTYEISFTAETSEPKDINIDIDQDYAPYAPIFSQTVTVSQWGVYGPYTFICEVDDPKTMFKFVVGGNKIPIAIDAVLVIDKLTTDVETTTARKPTEFDLRPNYPNPFNPETTIQYALTQNGRVRLSIFNPVGEMVSEFSEIQNAGLHTFRWNGLDHSGIPVQSGLYVYRLEIDGRVQSRKMLLVR
jgi:hypothetical protein